MTPRKDWPGLYDLHTSAKLAEMQIDETCLACGSERFCLVVAAPPAKPIDNWRAIDGASSVALCVRCINNLEHDTHQRIVDGPDSDGDGENPF